MRLTASSLADGISWNKFALSHIGNWKLRDSARHNPSGQVLWSGVPITLHILYISSASLIDVTNHTEFQWIKPISQTKCWKYIYKQERKGTEMDVILGAREQRAECEKFCNNRTHCPHIWIKSKTCWINMNFRYHTRLWKNFYNFTYQLQSYKK